MDYKNPGVIKFKGVIKNAGGGGAYIDFPFSVEELFGVKGRVPANMTFDGVAYRGSLAKMDQDCHMVPILKSIREQIGKQFGDEVEITVELDTAERKVEIPAELQALLNKNQAAADYFNTLAYSHQKEYVNWINEAKREETKISRIEKALQMLIDKQKLGR